MSEEMAVSDSPSGEDAVVKAGALVASAEDAAPEAPELPNALADPEPEETKPIKSEPEWSSSEAPDPEPAEKPVDDKLECGASAALSNTADDDFKGFVKTELNDSIADYKRVLEPELSSSEAPDPEPADESVDDKRGVKRRASAAFSNTADDEFKGFVKAELNDSIVEYQRVLENLEAEVAATSKTVVPLRIVMGTPTAPARASKRARQDTDGSRPSSALSSRSEGEGGVSSTEVSSSPAARGRRATTEMSSPLLRVPLERGWKRELVYRAALDQHSRRNADIYYYTPQGKKLRSTREVSEHLSGTGLSVENFSFFKEPLGVDDPEKEIIRDAKLMRRVESPVAQTTPTTEGKRTPKPKAPKGASPEPQTPKSPPAKIKVKSMQPRLNRTPAATPPAKKPAATPAAQDNNNTQAFKKNRTAPPSAAAPASAPVPAPVPPTPVVPVVPVVPVAPVAPVVPVAPVGPVAPAPAPQRVSPVDAKIMQDELTSPPRQLVQPCSMTCGRGVPTLACGACLCLYHPACVGRVATGTFFCKNCRKSSSPPSSPPPLTHKSAAALPAPAPRRVPAPAPVPVPVGKPRPPSQAPDKRVTLRMKMAGGPDGAKTWAVSPARGSLPQSLAVLNGRRFIVVPRALVQPAPEAKMGLRGRVANGAASSPIIESPRRRGRPRMEESTDHFTAFYDKAQQHKYDVCVQIFQYLGMRDLAHCARVCRLWRDLAATPQLWRHVRMKNSHVSDWGGLFAALRRHGTRRLDLRKMLLPQNDATFWEQFAEQVKDLDQLERIEMCRCPASAVEAVCRGVPNLHSLSALAIRSALLDPAPLGALPQLHELRLKSMAGLSLTRDLQPLAALTRLTHLSLTSIKELGWCACDVVGQLPQLESLELGECSFRAEFALVLGKLARLRRLRLERGTAQCAAPALLRALALLPLLTSLELVNFDVKVGFDDALAECKNIQRLLIIPTYVSQSATTNKQVLSGVLRLKDTLTHLMWGVTIELLRVTELFIDQCEQGTERRRDVGECIPVLKPVPGCRLPDSGAGTKQEPRTPPQVEILPLPTLQRLLSAQLPNTKLKLLRIPFHATWRQSLADFQ